MSLEHQHVYAFAERVTIAGEDGPACVEHIAKPLKGCPQASTRVIVRWEGRLRPGTRIQTGGRELVVVRMFPMTPRMRIAHLLCAPAPTENGRTI